jgi:hypothetical protein
MKRIIIAVVGVLAMLIALAAIGLWWFETRSMPTFFTQDAVQVIAYAASDMFQRNPATTQDEIDLMIKFQHEASNINLKINPNGKAVDPFGTPFRVERHFQAGTALTTVTSAGPDRRFGTRDDIQFVHKREAMPPPATQPEKDGWGEAVNGLQSRIVLDKRTFKQGEPVRVRVEVRNVSDKPVRYDGRDIGWAARAGWSICSVFLPDGKPAPDISETCQIIDGYEKYEYSALAPGKTITVDSGNLGSHYYLRTTGKHKVVWRGTRLEVADREAWSLALSRGEDIEKLHAEAAKSATGLPPSGEAEIEITPAPGGGPDGDLVGRLLKVIPPNWQVSGPKLLQDGIQPTGRMPGRGSSVALIHRPVPDSLTNNAGMNLYVMAGPADLDPKSPDKAQPCDYLGKGPLGCVYLWAPQAPLAEHNPRARWNHAAHDIAVALDVTEPRSEQPMTPDWGWMVSRILAESARAAQAEKLEPLCYFCEKAEIRTAKHAPLTVNFESNLVPPTKGGPAARKDPQYPYSRVLLLVRPVGPEGQLKMAEADQAIKWDGTSSTRGYKVKRLGVEIVVTVLSDDAKFVKTVNGILDQEISRTLRESTASPATQPSTTRAALNLEDAAKRLTEATGVTWRVSRRERAPGLPAKAGPAQRREALVADDATGEAHQDRGEGCLDSPVRDLPDGGGRHPSWPVPGHP